MNSVRFPAGLQLATLASRHRRKEFASGSAPVDEWLRTRALQNQEKRLSTTRVLCDDQERIVGFFTLATGQVDFQDLPAEIVRRLPRRQLPVAVLAWLGVSSDRQGEGIGRLLVAQALRDCHAAGQTFAFVAVVLDCLDERAKSFYRQWDFEELPGHPLRLFLSAAKLDAMMSPASS